MPTSLRASFSDSSSTSLPACSIASSREASVCRGLGLVLPSNGLIFNILITSPLANSGRVWASSSFSFSLSMAFHPGFSTTLPLLQKQTPSESNSTEVESISHLGETASSILATTRSYIFCSLSFRPVARISVGSRAWWSVTFVLSTLWRLSFAPTRFLAWSLKRAFACCSSIRAGSFANTSSGMKRDPVLG